VALDSRVKDGRRQDCVDGGALERRTRKKEGRKEGKKSGLEKR
jgi:hypothetical protein